MPSIFIGKSDNKDFILNSSMMNRHGIITGSTGSGKTVTMKVLLEEFSKMGIPSFVADMKGDVKSLGLKGFENEKIIERLKLLNIDSFEFEAFPVEFWDIFQEKGIPLRCGISSMGPIMLASVLGLNEVQSAILNSVFKIADEKGLLLKDLKDLISMLNYVSENSKEFSKNYGNMQSQSVLAILRSLKMVEEQGGNLFFSEPEIDLNDLFKKDERGYGYINILSCEKLITKPSIYSAFLLYMLSYLYETLPEIGDTEIPKFAFFFDEAHMLFDNISKELLSKIELTVRLIRSKGVGVFFITQNPLDVPDEISSNLGTKITHSLRAYTPKELKNIKVVSMTYRQEEKENLEKVLMELEKGEALISTLDEKGIPTYAKRVLIRPPKSSFDAIDDLSVQKIVNNSKLYQKYGIDVDSFSAYEALEKQSLDAENEESVQNIPPKTEKSQKSSKKSNSEPVFGGHLNRMTKSIFTSIGRELGRQITRGLLGNFKR